MKNWARAKYNKITIGRVISIKVDGDSVRFREECDRYFEVSMTINNAKQVLNDALLFIEELENKNNGN